MVFSFLLDFSGTVNMFDCGNFPIFSHIESIKHENLLLYLRQLGLHLIFFCHKLLSEKCIYSDKNSFHPVFF